MKPSPPSPNAVPGATPTFAASTRSSPSRGHPAARPRKRTNRRPRRPGRSDAAGGPERAADDVAATAGARDLLGDESVALVERGDAGPLEKTATPEVGYWTRFSMTWPSAGGASIQPRRQPVIAQFFEKVSTKRMRSASSRYRERRARVALVDEAACRSRRRSTHKPWRRARSSTKRWSSGVAVQPVGLDGELTKIARVRGVTAARAGRWSSTQPAGVNRHAEPLRAWRPPRRWRRRSSARPGSAR